MSNQSQSNDELEQLRQNKITLYKTIIQELTVKTPDFNTFQTKSLPVLNDLFDSLCPTLWNPYPLLGLSNQDFSVQIKKEKMFSDMDEKDVRQFVEEMKEKGDKEMVQVMEKMKYSQFTNKEVDGVRNITKQKNDDAFQKELIRLAGDGIERQSLASNEKMDVSIPDDSSKQMLNQQTPAQKKQEEFLMRQAQCEDDKIQQEIDQQIQNVSNNVQNNKPQIIPKKVVNTPMTNSKITEFISKPNSDQYDDPRINQLTEDIMKNTILASININTNNSFGEAEKIVKNPQDLTCVFCQVAFTSTSGITKHYNTLHHKEITSGSYSTCTIPVYFTNPGENQCGSRIANKKQFVIHIISHKALKPFVCKKCSCSFDCEDMLLIHQQMHNFIVGDNGNSIKCRMSMDHKTNISKGKECGKLFKDQDLFLSHLIDMHRLRIKTDKMPDAVLECFICGMDPCNLKYKNQMPKNKRNTFQQKQYIRHFIIHKNIFKEIDPGQEQDLDVANKIDEPPKGFGVSQAPSINGGFNIPSFGFGQNVQQQTGFGAKKAIEMPKQRIENAINLDSSQDNQDAIQPPEPQQLAPKQIAKAPKKSSPPPVTQSDADLQNDLQFEKQKLELLKKKREEKDAILKQIREEEDRIENFRREEIKRKNNQQKEKDKFEREERERVRVQAAEEERQRENERLQIQKRDEQNKLEAKRKQQKINEGQNIEQQKQLDPSTMTQILIGQMKQMESIILTQKQLQGDLALLQTDMAQNKENMKNIVNEMKQNRYETQVEERVEMPPQNEVVNPMMMQMMMQQQQMMQNMQRQFMQPGIPSQLNQQMGQVPFNQLPPSQVIQQTPILQNGSDNQMAEISNNDPAQNGIDSKIDELYEGMKKIMKIKQNEGGDQQTHPSNQKPTYPPVQKKRVQKQVMKNTFQELLGQSEKNGQSMQQQLSPPNGLYKPKSKLNNQDQSRIPLQQQQFTDKQQTLFDLIPQVPQFQGQQQMMGQQQAMPVYGNQIQNLYKKFINI